MNKSSVRDEIEPEPFIVRRAATLPQGRALDVACGSGRHALLLARLGFRVTAVDREGESVAAAARKARAEHLQVAWTVADLEQLPLPAAYFDLIVNTRYLQRSLLGPLRDALKPGGVILFETFTLEQRRFGRPANPEFLLRPGELAAAFSEFTILEAFEGIEKSLSGRLHAVARLAAQKPSGPAVAAST